MSEDCNCKKCIHAYSGNTVKNKNNDGEMVETEEILCSAFRQYTNMVRDFNWAYTYVKLPEPENLAEFCSKYLTFSQLQIRNKEDKVE